MPNPSDVRLAIAAQRTVPHSIAAFLRAVCSHIYAAADFGNPKIATGLADDISKDPAAWTDALTANTPLATSTATDMDMSLVPTHMVSVFATHGMRQTPTQAQTDAVFGNQATLDATASHAAGMSGQLVSMREQADRDRAAADEKVIEQLRADEAEATADQNAAVAAVHLGTMETAKGTEDAPAELVPGSPNAPPHPLPKADPGADVT